MTRITLLLISLLWGINSQAGTINQAIITAQHARRHTLQQQENRVHQLGEQSRTASHAYDADVNTFLQAIGASRAGMQQPSNTVPQVILFVSLGMPTTLLQQYLREGHRYHVPLVIRGLLQNNLPLTLQRMKTLLTLPTGKTLTGGIVIDPIWFQRYHIRRVPTLIINVCPDCQGASYDRITGNLFLDEMLRRMASAGMPSTQTVVKKMRQQQTEEGGGEK